MLQPVPACSKSTHAWEYKATMDSSLDFTLFLFTKFYGVLRTSLGISYPGLLEASRTS